MNGCEYVPLYHLLGEHDGILVVVTLPRHKCYHQVAAESKLSVLAGITFGENLSLDNLVTLAYDRLEEYGCALVGPAVDRKLVNGLLRREAYEDFILGTVVLDMDFVGIHVSHFTVTLCNDLGA